MWKATKKNLSDQTVKLNSEYSEPQKTWTLIDNRGKGGSLFVHLR